MVHTPYDPDRANPREHLDDVELRRRAGQLLDRTLQSLHLPPVEGAEEAVRAAARDVAPAFVSALAALYGLSGPTDLASFRRAYVEGALAGWKPGTSSRCTRAGLRVDSPGCPLLSAIAQEPRLCEACQRLHEETARLMIPEEFRRVAFHRLAVQGDPSCAFTFVLDAEAGLLRRARELI